MKKIITIVLVLLTNFVFSQSRLDTLIFKQINNLRFSKGLKELKWDTSCYLASKNQNDYLFERNKKLWPKVFCSHTQPVYKNPSDRFELYSNLRPESAGEVALAISKNYDFETDSLLDTISIAVVNSWLSSPPHKKILLGRFTHIGINCQYFTKTTNYKFSLSYRIVATGVLIKN